jgi:N-acetylneuraminic acid mutarotase
MTKLICLLLLISPLSLLAQSENSWTKKNDFGGLKRERAVAFTIGDYGYVGTGVDTAEIVMNDFWRYDPLSDSWTQQANVPGSARRDAVGFAIGGKGYIGTGIDNDESFSGVKLKDFWEYEPLFNAWVQIADFPGSGAFGIYFATGFSVDSKGYVCGGKVGPNTYSNQLWEYKPSINQWTQRANFPGGVRYQLSSFAVGYYAYVGLGANQDIFKKDFWKYNPGTNQWTQISDLPASERGAACTFSIGSRGFVCMGTDGGLLDDLWEYDPDSDHWTVRAPYGGSERKNAVAFVIYGKAYVGTGKGYSGKKAGMEEYTPMDIVGLNELSQIEFSVYPNPSSSTFSISTKYPEIKSFDLYTSDGRLVKEIPTNHSKTVHIHHDELLPGIYFLQAKDALGTLLKTEQIILF